jgi:hypothetical protein
MGARARGLGEMITIESGMRGYPWGPNNVPMRGDDWNQ